MDLKKWKKEWVSLETEEQRSDFAVRFKEAIRQTPDDKRPELEAAFLEMAASDLEEAENLLEVVKLRNKLEPVLNFISLSEIAKVYFGKSRHWLYHRLNGTNINGVPAEFTANDLSTLKTALNEISEKIRKAALSI
ncbi:DUF5053 domain-containing protein [Parabacteroides sp. PF5-9]|uniref:DUF5053 domain-containing protein n=1 Tax=Parabacteroides sp. PF5-9 TaxID=1742404 RepID=UPI002475A45C|nr:DUF5053 domain-containing protein [Parabacteroides sp. PF5-9]MDH6358086.1 hypothetical protein [Parabacteroides sp. PF5-9]